MELEKVFHTHPHTRQLDVEQIEKKKYSDKEKKVNVHHHDPCFIS